MGYDETEREFISHEEMEAYYRQRELDMFFEWYFNKLDDLIRKDPSEAYEAFHERRLGLGLSEEQCDAEKVLYLARKEKIAEALRFFKGSSVKQELAGQIPF